MKPATIALLAACLFTACEGGEGDPLDPLVGDCGVADAACGADVEPIDAGECDSPQCPNGMRVLACEAGNPDCITVEACGETIFCAADESPCDMASILGLPTDCPEGDATCQTTQRLDGSSAQCLPLACGPMIEGVEPPDCPNDTNVRACDADEVCPDPLVLCGRVWPGCRLVCAPDEIPGGVHCARDEVDCDPTTCDEEDPSCTQSPTPGVACYAAHCADGGPRCSDLDAAYLECEEPSVCVELFACGRVQRCRIDD